jgi:uncharacterized protein (DUF433 family)
MVSTILGALAGGDTIQMVLEDYPNLSEADIHAALEFAKTLTEYQIGNYEAVA